MPVVGSVGAEKLVLGSLGFWLKSDRGVALDSNGYRVLSPGRQALVA
jgi:hypothetical protein